jgi:hypothetical protein
MVLAFFEASPYKELGYAEDRVQQLITLFEETTSKRLCLLWLKDDKPKGLLAGVIETSLFSWTPFASELVFWVDEDARKSRAAVSLVGAYEYWAKAAGCQYVTLVDLMGNLHDYYTRKGYELRERTYLKRF